MKDVVEYGLQRIEENGEIVTLQSVSGGDINEAYYVQTREHEYFVKLNRQMPASFFDREAEGLEVIRNTQSIDVPTVYRVIVEPESHIPMLWLEWIEGRKRPETEVRLGERLAAIHLCEGAGFGWDGDVYIGKLKENSEIHPSWLAYYRDLNGPRQWTNNR